MTIPVNELSFDDVNRELARREWEEYVRWRGFKHMAERHIRVWRWFESLGDPDAQPRDLVECWGRGGAKSSTIEEGTAWIGARRRPFRRFVLYVSATQEQADNHVQAIATNLTRLGASPAVGKTGAPKGWRRNQLRTADGFNVAALGLDTGARGIKLDEFRPDLIVLDDIDDREDTETTVNKKRRTVTQTIIPAGGPDCRVVFVQNLIHEGGLMAELYSDKCEWLMDRQCGPMEPAVLDLQCELRDQGDGRNQWVITGGTPTWLGQDLATCQRQINQQGFEAFMRESQHDVKRGTGRFFITERIRTVAIDDVPGLVSVVITCDMAATEGAGDYSVFMAVGFAENGNVYVLNVWRKQVETEGFYNGLVQFRAEVTDEYGDAVDHLLPVDPGAAGKHWAATLARFMRQTYGNLVRVRLHQVRGKKAMRARRAQEEVNAGNVFIVEGEWNKPFLNELGKYSEDPKEYEYDDQVDTLADAVNDRANTRKASVRRVSRGR